MDKRILILFKVGHSVSKYAHPVDPTKTHHWVCYVRNWSPRYNLDKFVDTVKFRLHETFDNYIRTVEKPPYEVAEDGYGTFLMPIHVYFLKRMTLFNYNIVILDRDNLHAYRHVILEPDPDEWESLISYGGIVIPKCSEEETTHCISKIIKTIKEAPNVEDLTPYSFFPELQDKFPICNKNMFERGVVPPVMSSPPEPPEHKERIVLKLSVKQPEPAPAQIIPVPSSHKEKKKKKKKRERDREAGSGHSKHRVTTAAPQAAPILQVDDEHEVRTNVVWKGSDSELKRSSHPKFRQVSEEILVPKRSLERQPPADVVAMMLSPRQPAALPNVADMTMIENLKAAPLDPVFNDNVLAKTRSLPLPNVEENRTSAKLNSVFNSLFDSCELDLDKRQHQRRSASPPNHFRKTPSPPRAYIKPESPVPPVSLFVEPKYDYPSLNKAKAASPPPGNTVLDSPVRISSKPASPQISSEPLPSYIESATVKSSSPLLKLKTEPTTNNRKSKSPVVKKETESTLVKQQPESPPAREKGDYPSLKRRSNSPAADESIFSTETSPLNDIWGEDFSSKSRDRDSSEKKNKKTKKSKMKKGHHHDSSLMKDWDSEDNERSTKLSLTERDSPAGDSQQHQPKHQSLFGLDDIPLSPMIDSNDRKSDSDLDTEIVHPPFIRMTSPRPDDVTNHSTDWTNLPRLESTENKTQYKGLSDMLSDGQSTSPTLSAQDQIESQEHMAVNGGAVVMATSGSLYSDENPPSISSQESEKPAPISPPHIPELDRFSLASKLQTVRDVTVACQVYDILVRYKSRAQSAVHVKENSDVDFDLERLPVECIKELVQLIGS